MVTREHARPWTLTGGKGSTLLGGQKRGLHRKCHHGPYQIDLTLTLSIRRTRGLGEMLRNQSTLTLHGQGTCAPTWINTQRTRISGQRETGMGLHLSISRAYRMHTA